MEEPLVEKVEQAEMNGPARNLEQNYDGEFSSYYGRSQNGKGDLFGEVLERRLGRRGAVKAGLVLGAGAAGASAAGGAQRLAAAPAAAASPSPSSASSWTSPTRSRSRRATSTTAS